MPPRRRRGCLWAFLVVLAVVVVGLAVDFASYNAEQEAKERKAETAAESLVELPEEDPEEAPMAAAIEITSTGGTVTHEDYEYEFDAYWSFKNNSGKIITAWQYAGTFKATDPLDRTFELPFTLSCTDAPLAVGESRAATETEAGAIGDLENCTLTPWDLNPYISNEAGFWHTLEKGGAKFTYEVRPTAVAFADGTRLGAAG